MKNREEKIRELHNDRNKLKGLLKKAKVAIDSINSKFKSNLETVKTLEGKLNEATERNKELT